MNKQAWSGQSVKLHDGSIGVIVKVRGGERGPVVGDEIYIESRQGRQWKTTLSKRVGVGLFEVEQPDPWTVSASKHQRQQLKTLVRKVGAVRKFCPLSGIKCSGTVLVKSVRGIDRSEALSQAEATLYIYRLEGALSDAVATQEEIDTAREALESLRTVKRFKHLFGTGNSMADAIEHTMEYGMTWLELDNIIESIMRCWRDQAGVA